VNFTKMHGIGNDYVVVDGAVWTVKDPSTLARRITSRRYGVGADGLLLALPPSRGDIGAEVRMRMFNPDGSEAEMCGNGIRCLCKFVHDRAICRADPMHVETASGVLVLRYDVDGDGRVRTVTVGMGRPVLEASRIPVDLAGRAPEGWLVDVPLAEAFGDEVRDAVPGRAAMTCVSMGNPHAVIFCPAVAEVALETLGPSLERHRIFPERINVHFVQVDGPRQITMRTWERGAGATAACGTGAAAACVAAVVSDRTEREVVARLPGGELELRWDDASGEVFMAGPATEVFEGTWADVDPMQELPQPLDARQR
jgi:diaminopimelate epimerase